MQDYLPFIVIGLATGAVYGLAGMGLVLTYKTSGILNFGYGAIAALCAFAFYFLRVDLGMAWPLAAVLTVGVFAPLLGLVMELFSRSIIDASETIKVVSTVGLILIVQAIGLLWHPLNPPVFQPFLPRETVGLGGVQITYEQFILFGFSLILAAGLYWFLRSARLGIVMRAVVDNPELVAMSGDSPARVRRTASVIGTMFAAVAGLFIAAQQSLEGVTITTLVFAAFGAAAIGTFSNLPFTFLGGLVIGVAAAVASKHAATNDWLGGLSPSLPFLVLLIVLVVIPRRKLVRSWLTTTNQVRRPYVAPLRLRIVAWTLTIGVLALMPVLQPARLAAWSTALIYMILFISLGLLVHKSGLISLCHMTFAAIGAAAYGQFTTNLEMPTLVALVLAALVAVPVGALIAIPAIRVSGVFLALATLGFAIAVEQVFYQRDFMFTSGTLGIPQPRPDIVIGGWDLASGDGYYIFLLVITVLVIGAVMAINASRLGRLLEAMANSTLALETHGASSQVLKVIVFCLVAAMASLAGALLGMLYQFGIGRYFPWFDSLQFVIVIMIIVIGQPWFAVIGAVSMGVVPGYLTDAKTNDILMLLFGLGAATAVFASRTTMPMGLQRFLDRIGGRKPPEVLTDEEVAAARRTVPPSVRRALDAERSQPGSGLELKDLTVRFGGVTAVDQVSLVVPRGQITGLIGPNGAGKTTIFNACSGLNRPSSGQVLLHGRVVTGASPTTRARAGLGRTFQRTELFNSMTVRQNVAMGREAVMAGSNPLTQLKSSRSGNRLIQAVTDEAMELTGIAHLADLEAGQLPVGQRRLVELARTLAGPFDLLLLDEPSSGLDGHESEQFGRILMDVVRDRGCGILLVEHDMTLVHQVCDHVNVLDFGRLVFAGSTEEMERSPIVRAAYLGDDGDLDKADVPPESGVAAEHRDATMVGVESND